MATCAPVKWPLRNSFSGSIGSLTRDSMPMKAAISATPTLSSATMAGLAQPSWLPRSRPSTSRNRPGASTDWPSLSTFGARGSLDSSTFARVIQRHHAPIGRLTRKIHCQSRPLVSAPPTSGPTANAPPMVAP